MSVSMASATTIAQPAEADRTIERIVALAPRLSEAQRGRISQLIKRDDKLTDGVRAIIRGGRS